MEIRSERGLVATFSFLFIIINCVAVYITFFEDTYSDISFFNRCVWVLCFAIILFLPFLDISIAYGRKLKMNKDGCIISLGRFERFYTWDQFAIKSVKRYKSGKLFQADYEKCVFFSIRYCKTKEGAFTGNCLCLHPWSCFTIHSAQDPNKKDWGRHSLKINEVDAHLFKEKMQKWGVKVEGLTEFS